MTCGPDSVFIVGHVSDVMQARFNAPVPSHDPPDPLGRSPFRPQVGYAEGHFIVGIFSHEVGDMAVNAKDLAQSGQSR